MNIWKIIEQILSAFIKPVETVQKVEAKVKKVVYPVGSAPLVVTGAHPYYTNGQYHTGVDFGANKGDPVKTPCDGTVIKAMRGKVNTDIESEVMIQPDDRKSVILFKHCDPTKVVTKGDRVSAGDLLGKIDNTGNWEGYHLHFGAKPSAGSRKYICPVQVLHSMQPNIRYKLLKGRYSAPYYTVRAVFEQENREALKIIERGKT